MTARQQVTRNPITGEETERPVSRLNARPNSRPGFVPALHLGDPDENENKLKNPIPNKLKLEPPTPGSVVSWGRDPAMYEPPVKPKPIDYHDTNAAKHHAKVKEHKAPDHVAKPNGIPIERLKLTDDDDDPKPAQQPKATVHDPLVQMLKMWADTPPAVAEQYKRNEALFRAEEKKKQAIVETVMVDQLSRSVMSDPDQDQPLTTPKDPFEAGIPMRNRNRKLHETKVQTAGAATENTLAKRFKFCCRFVSKDGKDASRELFGFYFKVDGTITIYELHQFGKRLNALPILNRGIYKHAWGRKKGDPITIDDIYEEASLTLSTEGIGTIPETIAKSKLMTLRVIDVDMLEKEALLAEGVSHILDKNKIKNALQNPVSAEELREKEILTRIQTKVRDQMRGRGIRGYTMLCSFFRQVDQNNDGNVSITELQSAMVTFRIALTDSELNKLWRMLDANNDGVLEGYELVRGLLGEMNEFRKCFVLKAFYKIDPQHRGVVNHEQMKMFFNAHKHPSVKSGQTSGQEIWKQFINSFDFCKKKEEVTYEEFEDYYEALSGCIDDNEQFGNIMRNSWNL